MQDLESVDGDFWAAADALVAASRIVIDRPRGSAHPRYPKFTYPLDYGYLEGTRSPDGGGIDVWIGSLAERRVTALIVTLDLVKRESEMKVLLGCTPEEQQVVLASHQIGSQSALLVTWLAATSEARDG
jgi:inorganic pyrophosphatase